MTSHTFTRSEIFLARDIFEQQIKRYFGEIWNIAWNQEMRGCDWYCTSPFTFDQGIWQLLQTVKHRGGTRVAPRIETKETNTILRFMAFYEPKQKVIV